MSHDQIVKVNSTMPVCLTQHARLTTRDVTRSTCFHIPTRASIFPTRASKLTTSKLARERSQVHHILSIALGRRSIKRQTDTGSAQGCKRVRPIRRYTGRCKSICCAEGVEGKRYARQHILIAWRPAAVVVHRTIRLAPTPLP